MKVFIAVLILIFGLQSWAKANDIRDLQIEGMSIEDSLLDYFSESKIKNSPSAYYPGSKKYKKIEVQIQYKDYDLVAFHFKTKDKKYLIAQIQGIIFYDKNIKKCKKKMDEVENFISDFLKKPRSNYNERKHPDKAGTTFVSEFYIEKGVIKLWCTDFTKKTENSKGYTDHFALSIESQDFVNWLNNEAWK
tara:strand:+ start:81 stop:653 length:573 start_codon:yes stop_codon:yes gene_type:complete